MKHNPDGAENKDNGQSGQLKPEAPAANLGEISPRTKLPVEHPESQAVERIHYEMQSSLCGLPITEADIDKLLKREDGESK